MDSDGSWSEIRSAYRRRAAIYHPDRGGDAEQFCRVRDAYELLACYQG
ncbi:MAG: DnaJ domain-containing protein [Motiliproteus sp.]